MLGAQICLVCEAHCKFITYKYQHAALGTLSGEKLSLNVRNTNYCRIHLVTGTCKDEYVI
jgi:hypothetical protein